MVSTIFWLSTTADKGNIFKTGGGGGNAKKKLGATDQPRYNGFRVISIRVKTTLQCTQLMMKFVLLMKLKYQQFKTFLC